MSYYRSSVSMKPAKVELDMEDDGCIVLRLYRSKKKMMAIHEIYFHVDQSKYDFFNGLDFGDKYILMEDKED